MVILFVNIPLNHFTDATLLGSAMVYRCKLRVTFSRSGLRVKGLLNCSTRSLLNFWFFVLEITSHEISKFGLLHSSYVLYH